MREEEEEEEEEEETHNVAVGTACGAFVMVPGVDVTGHAVAVARTVDKSRLVKIYIAIPYIHSFHTLIPEHHSRRTAAKGSRSLYASTLLAAEPDSARIHTQPAPVFFIFTQVSSRAPT